VLPALETSVSVMGSLSLLALEGTTAAFAPANPQRS